MSVTLAKILKASSNKDVEEIVSALGTTLKWIPLGNDPQNLPRISIGSNPYDGITERITNAMDAMIEFEAIRNNHIYKLSSPRKAIEAAYGISGGYLKAATKDDINTLSSNIKVKFQDSGSPKRPTIEIYDRGMGQHPSDFHKTLCSINSNYKYQKFYLIGEFGQGGQSSFSYIDEYAIIISRKFPEALIPGQEDLVGATIIRFHDPSTSEELCKYGRYEYCVSNSTNQILTFKPSDLPMALEHGTIIKLIAYDLPKGASDALQPAGTAWSFISESLFDPVLPMKLYELREKYYNKERESRTISGLAPRLWRGRQREQVKIAVNDSYEVSLGPWGTFKINYWALAPNVEEGTKSSWRDLKKGYVSSNKAVFITLNGQKHDEYSSSFLRENCNLTYSHEYLIVHVDCDNLTNVAKKKLFSSTRERMKSGELEELLKSEVAKVISLDRNIMKFENDRKGEIINARAKRDTTKAREMVGKYISRYPEYRSLISLPSSTVIITQSQLQEKSEDDSEIDDIQEKELEIPTLNTIPTYIKITNSRDPIPVEKGGNALIRIETDAIDDYLAEPNSNRFRAIFLENKIQLKSKSGLRNGKISYYIHCPSSVRISSKDRILLELDLPDGGKLTTERIIVCRDIVHRKKKESKTKLLEPNIRAITHEEDVWVQRGFNYQSVGEIWLDATNPCIIVSVDNENLTGALNKLGNNPELRQTTEGRYISAIAFYLFLKKVDDNKNHKNKEEAVESPNSDELQRVSRTISSLIIPSELIS